MSDLIPFQFENQDVRVHIEDDGSFWLEAQDVCIVLGIRDTSQALTRLPSKEKRTSKTRNVLIINESGLYRLIFRSNKPEAQRFQDWVFAEVLPAIRKTGRYEPYRPVLHNPMSQVMIDTVIRVDALEYEVAERKKENARLTAQVIRTETKADLALEDAHRMTLEEFICKNGLLRQFPRSQFPAYARWLKALCDEHGLQVLKAPVYGQPWDGELAYPLAALAAWVRHEHRKPQQVQLVPARQEGDG